MLEKALESPLESKEIKPVNLKGNQPWILLGRSDAEAEASVLCPPDANSWLIRKDSDAGKDWRLKGDRGWDSWMVSPIQRTWTWVNSGRWWGTGKPGVLQSLGPQRVGHDLATEQQQQQITWVLANQKGVSCKQPVIRVYRGFPIYWWLSHKESALNAGDLGSVPGLWRFPGEGNGNLLQYSCLGNPMDRGAWLGPQGCKRIRATKQQSKYGWPLNNSNLNCASPYIEGFFFSSKYYGTTQSGLVNSLMWRKHR